MNRTVLLSVAMLISTPLLADEYVQGYMRKDGTYVPGHYRTTPNQTKLDNYSTRGNANPYTGKKGTVDPYAIHGDSLYSSQPRSRGYSYDPSPYTFDSSTYDRKRK